MSDTLATSFGVLNYSGMLFNKGNTRCPLSSIIGGRAKTTNHVEFVTGQEYTTGGGEQPAISETASLTAPEASVITRTQKTNVTQIFMEAVGISYAKQSNMGTLSGLNVANQQANPINELDFQVAAKMQKVNRDIEFTFIQGTFNKATSDATINKTRGLVEAITTNTKAMSSKPLGLWDIADMVKKIYGANAPTDGLACGVTLPRCSRSMLTLFRMALPWFLLPVRSTVSPCPVWSLPSAWCICTWASVFPLVRLCC